MSLDPQLPKPGHVVIADYRSERQRAVWQLSKSAPLKILQWNIERGYQLEHIISELRRLDADILGLQEIDVACDRSGNKDVGRVIAEQLGYNYAFLCEFEELHSPVRDRLSQGGGVHGNAILTKFDMANIRAIEHSHHPVNWESPIHPLAVKEPRKGRRLTLAAEVLAGEQTVLCYCCHLEVFCGLLDRVMQFADVWSDCRQQNVPHQVILGDLNTMANGVARYIFCVTEDGGEPGGGEVHNRHLLRLGLAPEVTQVMVNPGFHDPFHPVKDITLDNPKYRLLGLSLMTGKLDWLLLRNMEVVSQSMGNHDYTASDHKWLLAQVRLVVGAPMPPSPLGLALRDRPLLLWAAVGAAGLAALAMYLRARRAK